ncbi:hypothetical protein Tco_1238759 [Tanacetum coccineum]
MKIEESLNVTFDETPPPSKTSALVGDDLDEEEATKTRKDYGTKRGHHSTSASSSTFDHPSSFHHVDDDNDEDDEGTSRVSTPYPTHFVNSLSNDVPQVFTNPPHDEQNFQTIISRQTEILNRQVQLRDEHRSRLRNTPSPQPNNPFLDDPLDAPPRPSNPLPLEIHPSLDITLSISPITPLDHMFETSSSPPPPQPPLMGHPIFFNVLDYYGAHCLCCFHNRNLILSLRDKMHFIFSHIEYLLTSAIASPSPPHH